LGPDPVGHPASVTTPPAPRPEGAPTLHLPDSIAGAGRERDRGASAGGPWSAVPWRTIVATIGAVVVAGALLATVLLASRLVVWTAIGGFFAVVLARPVRWVQQRCHVRRGLAIGAVVALTLALTFGLLAVFVMAVRTQLVAVLTDLPGTVQQAAAGQGPVGRAVTRLNLERLVHDHQQALTDAARRVQDALPGLLGAVLEGALAAVTITVMTCLFLSQSAPMAAAGLKLLPVRHRARAAAVGRDAAAAVSGYMIGNLAISLCAGVSAFVVLLTLGVPSAVVLALWVAFADLIPLVGATIGAVVAVGAAFLTSSTAGIVAIVFFVIYQQFENNVLQVVVMTRTVRVNALVVLLSVLLGVELFGFVGALLAVPLAGGAAVVAKEMWRHRTAPDGLYVIGGDTDAEAFD
jgi:predicted PurR-regulated permease PerM